MPLSRRKIRFEHEFPKMFDCLLTNEINYCDSGRRRYKNLYAHASRRADHRALHVQIVVRLLVGHAMLAVFSRSDHYTPGLQELLTEAIPALFNRNIISESFLRRLHRHQRLLLRHPLRAILCKALDPRKDRGRIEMRLGNHFRLESAGEPLMIPVRCQRVSVG